MGAQGSGWGLCHAELQEPLTDLDPGLGVVVNLSPILVSVARTIWVA